MLAASSVDAARRARVDVGARERHHAQACGIDAGGWRDRRSARSRVGHDDDSTAHRRFARRSIHDDAGGASRRALSALRVFHDGATAGRDARRRSARRGKAAAAVARLVAVRVGWVAEAAWAAAEVEWAGAVGWAAAAAVAVAAVRRRGKGASADCPHSKALRSSTRSRSCSARFLVAREGYEFIGALADAQILDKPIDDVLKKQNITDLGADGSRVASLARRSRRSREPLSAVHKTATPHQISAI